MGAVLPADGGGEAGVTILTGAEISDLPPTECEERRRQRWTRSGRRCRASNMRQMGCWRRLQIRRQLQGRRRRCATDVNATSGITGRKSQRWNAALKRPWRRCRKRTHHLRRQMSNTKTMNTEVEIEDLCKSEKEAKFMASESEKKFDEISRRLGVVQEELKKAEERADSNQKKVDSIDEELKVVGENMKALEVAEGKALEREEKFKEQILILLNRLKIADARAEYGEMNITKLNKRIDNIEDDIIRAKVKSSHVGGEMNDTFKDIMHKY